MFWHPIGRLRINASILFVSLCAQLVSAVPHRRRCWEKTADKKEVALSRYVLLSSPTPALGAHAQRDAYVAAAKLDLASDKSARPSATRLPTFAR